MGRKIEVKMYCQMHKDAYMAVFEEKNPREWYWVESKAIPKAPAQKPSLLARLGFVKKTPQSQEKAPTLNVEGGFYSDAGSCPLCGNSNFVKCGGCHEMFCSPVGATYFTCYRCGNAGEIVGAISDISGSDMGENGSDKAQLSDTSPKQNNFTLS